MPQLGIEGLSGRGSASVGKVEAVPQLGIEGLSEVEAVPQLVKYRLCLSWESSASVK